MDHEEQRNFPKASVMKSLINRFLCWDLPNSMRKGDYSKK